MRKTSLECMLGTRVCDCKEEGSEGVEGMGEGARGGGGKVQRGKLPLENFQHKTYKLTKIYFGEF